MVKLFTLLLCGLFLLGNILGITISPTVGFFIVILNILISAMMVVLAKNPINSLFFLISTYFNSSIFLIILNFDFVAIIFILIYIGAISVLFLFMVMFLNINLRYNLGSSSGFYGRILLFGMCFVGLLYFTTTFMGFSLERNLFNAQNLTSIKFSYHGIYLNFYEIVGHFFYTYYGFSLVLVSVLLLIIMIGAIILPLLVQGASVQRSATANIFLKRVVEKTK